MIFGDRTYITFNTKLSNFRGHYVPLKANFRGHLKQKGAKSPCFEGQGKPCYSVNVTVTNELLEVYKTLISAKAQYIRLFHYILHSFVALEGKIKSLLKGII